MGGETNKVYFWWFLSGLKNFSVEWISTFQATCKLYNKLLTFFININEHISTQKVEDPNYEPIKKFDMFLVKYHELE